MGVLPDWQIERDITIEPFAPQQRRPGVISYGVTSYGYDVRLGRKFKVFTNAHCAIVDPKNFDPRSFIDFEADSCLIPPNSFALAETVEYFEIPRDILCVCLGKSTYARIGIIVNVTPLEPEWRGKITIEISNTTPLPAKVYAGEGISKEDLIDFLFTIIETDPPRGPGRNRGKESPGFGWRRYVTRTAHFRTRDRGVIPLTLACLGQRWNRHPQ